MFTQRLKKFLALLLAACLLLGALPLSVSAMEGTGAAITILNPGTTPFTPEEGGWYEVHVKGEFEIETPWNSSSANLYLLSDDHQMEDWEYYPVQQASSNADTILTAICHLRANTTYDIKYRDRDIMSGDVFYTDIPTSDFPYVTIRKLTPQRVTSNAMAEYDFDGKYLLCEFTPETSGWYFLPDVDMGESWIISHVLKAEQGYALALNGQQVYFFANKTYYFVASYSMYESFDETSGLGRLVGLVQPADIRDARIGQSISIPSGYGWASISPTSDGHYTITAKFSGDPINKFIFLKLYDSEDPFTVLGQESAGHADPSMGLKLELKYNLEAGKTYYLQTMTSKNGCSLSVKRDGAFRQDISFGPDQTGVYGLTAYTGFPGGLWSCEATNSAPDGGVITYSSSNSSVLTVNSTTGELTCVGAGVATITATAAATEKYPAASASYKVTIEKADINNCETAAPAPITILANNANNAADKLKAALHLPANATIKYYNGWGAPTNPDDLFSYTEGTAQVPITWANATEKFNAKGGTYTFKGTIPESQNFKAYNANLTATLTVTPVTGTLATALPASVVVAQSQATSAASYADFKLPSSITINCDNGVAAQTITPEWSVPLNTLKSKRAGTKTVVKVTNVPAWLTIGELSVEVQVTDKFPVKVNVTQANGTYGAELAAPVAAQSADGNGTDPSGTFTYKYTGRTAAGKAYNSATKPTEAGSYTVTATLVSDTHAGSGSADFTIAPKALTSGMIGAIDPVTYTGSAQTPALTVTDGKTLVKNTDYTVEYTNNTNAGTATATITGKGNYTGTASKTFTIQPKDISGLTVTISGTPEVDQALLATVSGAETSGLTYAWTSDGSSVAGQTKPYLILTSAYENKQIAVTVTGSGNYTGTVSAQAVTVGASTNESTSVAVPAKPEVSANPGNRQISVSVSVPTEETDKPVCLYEIQLCDSNGALIETYYSLTNSYTITGLTNGTAYQVKAIAYNVNGASAQSDAATATPQAPAPIGGGSSGGDTDEPTDEPVITENPDGSTTTTETAEDGTVTATTTWDDGKKAVAVKSPEGEKAITVTTAAGEKVADVSIPAIPAAGKEFEDVKDGAWYESAVDTATGYGLFNGTTETTFSPNDPMTRGMLATVLYNLSGKPEYGTDTAVFEDVASGQWYEDPVDWAYKAGVTSGTSDTEFSPNRDITREQLVTMLYRYANLIGAGSKKRTQLNSFPDGAQVTNYAQNAMEWAVAEGFISGRASGSKNYIAPQDTATRAEVAAVLTRFVEYLKK